MFSRKHAARARRSGVPPRVFQEKFGRLTISVDRLSLAPLAAAKSIAAAVGRARRATFYGWAVVAASDAADSGRTVHSTPQRTPQLENPYHADIELPELAKHDPEELKRHAQELADASQWQAAEVKDD